MPNVMFKRGSNQKLNENVYNFSEKRAINVQDGTFYLTEDTHRLYIGQGNELVELNKSITTVDNVSQLPKTGVALGQFYYINGTNQHKDTSEGGQNGNILAVCTNFDDNGNAQWTQVNPDTNTDTGYHQLLNTSKVTKNKDTTNNTITYTITLERNQTGVNGNTSTTSLSPITMDFVVDGNDLVDVIPSTSVGLKTNAVNASNDSVEFYTDGAGANKDQKVTVIGGTNVSLSGGGTSAVTINADDTTYSFNSPANSQIIQYTANKNGTPQGGNQTMVTFVAGDGVAVSGENQGEIKYSHAEVEAIPAKTTTATASNNAEITVVSNVQKDSFGHVTAVDTVKVTAKDTTYTANGISANDSGDLTFSIMPSSGGSSSKTATGVLYHKITVDGKENTIYNQKSLGSFYSATEIDKKIAGLGAMHYKGTLGGTNGDVASLPTADVYPGDTYMVNAEGAGPNTGSRIGDLYIATGTKDDTTGKITSGLKWELVPAGNDPDTRYTFSVSKGVISATPTTTGGAQTVAEIVGGNKISVSTDNKKITINHDLVDDLPTTEQGDNSTVSEPLNYSDTFKVPNFTLDEYGHIISAGESTLQLPASVDSKYKLSVGTAKGDQGTTPSYAPIVLTASGSSSGTTSAVISGDLVAIDIGKSGTNLQVSHKALLKTGTAGTEYGKSASKTPSASGKIKIPSLVVNAQGHVTSIKEQEITLPPDQNTLFQLRPTTVSTSTATVNNEEVTTATAVVNMSNTTLATGDASTSNVILRSSSLQLVTDGTGNNAGIKADIVWGSFNS